MKASTEALSYVLERGGRLYLWAKDVGEAWVTDEESTHMPSAVDFVLISNDVIEIYLERGIEPPAELRLKLHHRPLRGLKIYWDGLEWGARGETVGGG